MEDYRTRRKEQARQTEQAILQAAMDLSRKQSFDKVSIREICQQAGITTGAFYHHFRSKEDLLSRGFAPLDTYLEQCLAGHEDDPPARRLWRLMTNYAEFLENLGWELVARYYFLHGLQPVHPSGYGRLPGPGGGGGRTAARLVGGVDRRFSAPSFPGRGH